MAELVLELDAISSADESPATSLDETPTLLTRYTDLIESGLRRSALPSRNLLGRMSGYHMGWLNADGRVSCAPGGKRLRPALCLWACEALDGDPQWALSAAVAIELIHNFTLIHDDIQDGDEQRRHRPTVWSIWGAAQGINAGDGMLAHALRILLAAGSQSDRRMRAAHLLSGAVVEVVEGQCLDISLEGTATASEATYLRLATAKTGALMGASLAAGALIAGADDDVVRRFDDAGRLLGLAFQIRDDWLGVWGDPELTGKGRTGDLERRKLTYPVVAALAIAPPSQRRELRRLFARRRPGAELKLRSLLDDLGGPTLTAASPLVLARDAVALLDACDLPPAALEDFAEVAIHAAERDR
jgi:geranylgeranyl diphosphate synthase, type I